LAANEFDESFSNNRYYNARDTATKHGKAARPAHGRQVSHAPTNGQRALDNSIPVSLNSPRRVGVDLKANEIVVFDRTSDLRQAHQA
jgi:hypothetical protein